MILIGLYAALFVYLENHFFAPRGIQFFKSFESFHAMISFAFSLLLVFRINSAYDRWWEGRKIWGALVNDSRNLALKIACFVEDEGSKRYFCEMIPNFAVATKEHLREGVLWKELDGSAVLKTEIRNSDHVPAAITRDMYGHLNNLRIEKKISLEQFLAIDDHLKKNMEHVGACERIKNTPIPFSYGLFLKKFILLFVLTVPLDFISYFHWGAVPLSMLIFYVFVSLELISEEIEDPFQKGSNDIQTDDIAINIRNNVTELLGGG